MPTGPMPANTLPKGWRAIPLVDGVDAPSPRICAVLRQADEAGEPRLVALRSTFDARVVLGCLVDAGGQVHDWLEIWVQDMGQLASAPISVRQRLGNQQLDERWRTLVDAFGALDGPTLLLTGWEHEHPTPICLDPEGDAGGAEGGGPITLKDEQSGSVWQLCTDDALLTSQGLAPYGTSAHRYLYLPDQPAPPSFVALTDDAPTNEQTTEWPDFEQTLAGLVPVNPGGGLMMVRHYAPMNWADAADVLGGAQWQGLYDGNALLDLDASVRWLSGQHNGDPGADAVDSDDLFLGWQGQSGRIAERFHLKLRLLADAFDSARHWVRRTGRPMFNITPESYHVRIGGAGRGLPALWAMQATLAQPGQSIKLSIPQGEAEYFLPASEPTLSIYRPEISSQATTGTASVRLRGMSEEGNGQHVLEGTLQSDHAIEPSRLDLLWLRIPLSGQTVDVYARLERDSALAAGEWRFRTVAQPFGDTQLKRLNEAQGVPLPRVAFELIPLLSTPCDLYSLAVLAVRTLLVDDESSLPKALDELLSLARQIGLNYDESVGLPVRIHALFESDARWLETLGPQRLTRERVTTEAAFDAVPTDLWWRTLAWIVRLFPGAGPDSICQHFGDSGGPLHRVFEAALAELNSLLVQTRSLIVVDWRYNREVASVLRRFQIGYAEAASDDAAASPQAQTPSKR